MDKLAEIMAWKRTEVAQRARPVTEFELARISAGLPKPPSFAAALRRADGALAVIAEIKRRSPSAGEISAAALAPDQALRYSGAGADALSILTDGRYFGGTLEDLRAVSAAVSLPRLRKDFMVHPFQVLEAREAGASAILIIVRALDDHEIKVLNGAAQAAGLDVLFEIHHESELERALRHGAGIVGVNNRDLSTFATDLGFSERIIPQFPGHLTAVSESGITCGRDAARVRAAGAHAILAGEVLMKSADPGALIREFRT